MLPTVVLISGNGSNLQAIIDAIHYHHLKVKILAVISNRPDAYGLIRATKANIPTEVIPHQQYASRCEFDAALQQRIDRYAPQLIVLAGFMRKLGPKIARHYQGKMINIHPSLLPKYPGLNTHQRVLADQEPEHGASIHFVTEDLDAGPVISQMKLKINATDTAASLQQRVQQLEHKLFPETLRWFSENRIKLIKEHIWFDDKPLKHVLLLS